MQLNLKKMGKNFKGLKILYNILENLIKGFDFLIKKTLRKNNFHDNWLIIKLNHVSIQNNKNYIFKKFKNLL